MWKANAAFPTPSISAQKLRPQSTSSWWRSPATGASRSLPTVPMTLSAASSILPHSLRVFARCLRRPTGPPPLISRRYRRAHHLLAHDGIVGGRLKQPRVRLIERHMVDHEIL